MKYHDNLRSRRRAAVTHRQTPEQMTVAREQALKWRDEWRAEMKACATDGNGTSRRAMRPLQEDKQAARFATAIARAEFGRFYWSDKQAAHPRVDGLRKTPSHAKSRKVKRK